MTDASGAGIPGRDAIAVTSARLLSSGIARKDDARGFKALVNTPAISRQASVYPAGISSGFLVKPIPGTITCAP